MRPGLFDVRDGIEWLGASTYTLCRTWYIACCTF